MSRSVPGSEPSAAPDGFVRRNADDARLLREVHPPDWVNPTPKGRYHLVVVGAGTGGLVTAAAAAGLGARVALVERYLMGGDCLNVGCVPSKAIIRAARAWSDARTGEKRFGAPVCAGDGDFAVAMDRMRRLRAQLSPIDGAARFTTLGVDVYLGHARFVNGNAVEVEGQRLLFRKAVIATGARPAVPNIPGMQQFAYHTNQTIFGLASRPEHLVVLGAGPIGCELAQAFARLGTAVTLVDNGSRLLPREVADASAVVEKRLLSDGVRIWHDTEVRQVEGKGSGGTLHLRHLARDESLECDALLVATGRVPNVDDLGLAAAGVAVHDEHGVTVDDRLRTTNRRIYAVGDVCSALKFTHSADFQARLVVRNALFFGRGRASDLITPRVTYTSPEVAQVGLTPDQAHQDHRDTDIIRVAMHDVDRAVLDGETEGFCEFVLSRGTDRILGATLVSEHAGETVGEVALAMTAKLGLAAIGRTMHPYPSQGEVLRKAADAWQRRKLTPRVKALFLTYFKWLG